jgi:spore coat assembly protein
MADAPVEDLIKPDTSYIREYRRRFIKRTNNCMRKTLARKIKEKTNVQAQTNLQAPESFFDLPGRVLHVDGNKEYLNLCLALYEQLGIKAKGIHIPENEQPASVPDLIQEHSPDIIVLTGHDGVKNVGQPYSDLNNYYNSRRFGDAVKAARRVDCDRDNLVIFAGACQSHYESLLESGANFASAPLRVLIHAFDPVFIVEKVAFTPINQTVSTSEAVANTITGIKGIGGIETRGKFRRGFPKSPY